MISERRCTINLQAKHCIVNSSVGGAYLCGCLPLEAVTDVAEFAGVESLVPVGWSASFFRRLEQTEAMQDMPALVDMFIH